MSSIFKSTLAALMAAFVAMGASAQDNTGRSITEILNASETITVSHPDQLETRLKPSVPTQNAGEEGSIQSEETSRTHSAVKRTAGYRVQVFSDNNARTAKDEAYSKAQAIADRFPQYPTYVVYKSPYWRLKVGDFRTEKDAMVAADEIKHAFPSYASEIRVVTDRINVAR